MRAAVIEELGQALQLRDLPTPRPGPGEVLVRVTASGVCFTDIKVSQYMAGSLPLIPGHEAVGVVVDVGAGVSSQRHGQRVAVHAGFPCGMCDGCSAGAPEPCQSAATFSGISRDGGYAEYVVAPADNAVELPDQLEFADAAPLLCAGLTTFVALRRAQTAPGDRVAIIGVGGLGHLGISIAAALGAQTYAVTGSPDKIDDATARGAHFAGTAAEVAHQLAEDGGAHVVLNTSDDLTPLTQVLPSMHHRGSVVLAAGSGESLPVSPDIMILRQLSVMGTFFGSPAELRSLLNLAARHNIRPQIERYKLGDINDVHDRLQDNRIRYRAIIEF